MSGRSLLILQGRQIVLICNGKAYLFTSHKGIQVQISEITDLCSSQEETDTRTVLYVSYAQRMGYHFARVKNPDSDGFFILLQYAKMYPNITVLFDTGTGNKKRLLNITEVAMSFSQVHCSALLGLHAFTGRDTTSALKDLEAFVCAVYGNSRMKDVNLVRFMTIDEICGHKDQKAPLSNLDMSSLPPCKRALEQQMLRVNYQVATWKRSHISNPDIPEPANHGWKMGSGLLRPHWFDGQEMPQQLVEISAANYTYLNSSDDESDTNSDANYDDFSQSDSEDE